MFDSASELLNQIQLGEDSRLEYKAVRFSGEKLQGPHRDSLAQELCSLANTAGGVFVLGVDDQTKSIEGIPRDKLDLVERTLREVCGQSIEPPLTPVILRLELPDELGALKAVIRVDVARSLWVHKAPGGYYHRIGSEKKEMSPEYLARLFQQRAQTRMIRFDEQPVPGTSRELLSEELWRRFLPEHAPEDSRVLLKKQKLLVENQDGAEELTVAGVLLATPRPMDHLPNAFIQAVCYAGEDRVPSEQFAHYQLDAEDIDGPLDQQVIGALQFVRRNMRVRASKEVGRTDEPEYDLLSVFEALVNAVAHRDYSIYGSKIRLQMFANRLEIYSPGALPNTMDVQSMALRQSARNEVLTSLLARLEVPKGDGLPEGRAKFMDKRGEGVPIILRRSEEHSGRRPVYALHGEELQLTIYAAGVE